ncbi:MAG: hypothetical protein ACRCZW_13365, partial [Lactobacillaceae bacterium]
MNDIEKIIIGKFFNKSGWVLDFTNESFSDFSVSSIGKNIMLSEKSKGKSLDFFLENGTEEDILKLTSSL